MGQNSTPICHLGLQDGSGVMKLTLWRPDTSLLGSMEGAVIKVSGVAKNTYKEPRSLQTTSSTKLEVSLTFLTKDSLNS